MSNNKKKHASSGKPATHKAAGKKPAASKAAPAKKGGGNSKKLLILGGVAVAAIAVVIALSSSGGSGGGGVKPSAEELKYLGRLLPANYVEPAVAKPSLYTSDVAMSDVTPADAGAELTVPVSEVASKKNVYFEYAAGPGGKPLPLLAYVKPSGKLFVGVSYCPPCEGERQTITADGALTCDSCGTKRNLESEAGLSGACKRYPLDEVPATVKGGNIVIEKAVLDGWTAQPLDRQVG